jgi:hypothetical protein
MERCFQLRNSSALSFTLQGLGDRHEARNGTLGSGSLTTARSSRALAAPLPMG